MIEIVQWEPVSTMDTGLAMALRKIRKEYYAENSYRHARIESRWTHGAMVARVELLEQESVLAGIWQCYKAVRGA